ncbi:hypothetical protein Tco_0100499, partial [Tanacetum coccineum]
MNVPVPLDHFPVNALTSKVFSFMVKKGKHFLGKVTPLFASMLVQLTEDEGATSERPSEPQSTPSPPYPNQAKEIKHLKEQIKKLKKQAKPVITHHRAWMKSVSLKHRLAGKKSLKSNWMQTESVSKQGRKFAKAEPSVHKDLLFDELDDDEIDNMDTEDAQDMGRTRNGVNEEKEGTEDAVSTKDAVSTEDVVSTDKEKVSSDRSKEKVSTDRSKDSTDKEKEGTDKEKDSTDKEKDSTDKEKE